jgi:hypothetical protein
MFSPFSPEAKEQVGEFLNKAASAVTLVGGVATAVGASSRFGVIGGVFAATSGAVRLAGLSLRDRGKSEQRDPERASEEDLKQLQRAVRQRNDNNLGRNIDALSAAERGQPRLEEPTRGDLVPFREVEREEFSAEIEFGNGKAARLLPHGKWTILSLNDRVRLLVGNRVPELLRPADGTAVRPDRTALRSNDLSRAGQASLSTAVVADPAQAGLSGSSSRSTKHQASLAPAIPPHEPPDGKTESPSSATPETFLAILRDASVRDYPAPTRLSLQQARRLRGRGGR